MNDTKDKAYNPTVNDHPKGGTSVCLFLVKDVLNSFTIMVPCPQEKAKHRKDQNEAKKDNEDVQQFVIETVRKEDLELCKDIESKIFYVAIKHHDKHYPIKLKFTED